MVHGDCYVKLIVMISFEKEILTMTFSFNVRIGHHKEIINMAFTFNALIGQINCHMIESFVYLTNSKCLLCNSHHGSRLTKYNPYYKFHGSYLVSHGPQWLLHNSHWKFLNHTNFFSIWPWADQSISQNQHLLLKRHGFYRVWMVTSKSYDKMICIM